MGCVNEGCKGENTHQSLEIPATFLRVFSNFSSDSDLDSNVTFYADDPKARPF